MCYLLTGTFHRAYSSMFAVISSQAATQQEDDPSTPDSGAGTKKAKKGSSGSFAQKMRK